MNDFIENLEIILISFGKKIFQDDIGVVLDQVFTEKYLKSNPTYCWLKTLSEEEFNFIKKIPLSTQKKIISHMTFKIYLLYFFIIFLIVMVLADGGLDYLLEPIIYHTP